jgi:hypothetical protein
MGIIELVNLLKEKIGKDYISNPSTNPNKSHDYRINVKALCNYFTDKKISQWANTHWSDKNTIKIKDFMDFIIGQTNNNNPRGTYHEYMDFVHTYWNIPINDENIPQYSILKEKDKNIYENINPKRKEYFIAWWIKNKIENDVFLKSINSEIKEKYLKQTYQEPIKKGDDRFYDILLKNINIIIEIQENSKAHNESYNDLTKESLCAMRGFRIKYFKFEEFAKSNIGYLNEFWNGNLDEDEDVDIDITNIKTNDYGLKSMIIQGLFSILDKTDREIVYKDFLIHNYLKSIKIKYNNLSQLVDKYNNNKKKYSSKLYKQKNQFNQDLRDKLELGANDETNSDEYDFIKIMNKWYKESSNTEEYCISPFGNDFLKIFCILRQDKEDFEKFIKLCWHRGYVGLNGNNYYEDSLEFDFDKLRFSWNSLSRLFIEIYHDSNNELSELLNLSNFCGFISQTINLMLTVERTYNSITSSIIIHEESRLNLSEQLMELLEKHIYTKMFNKYEKEIDSLKKQLDISQRELSNYKLQTNKLVRKTNTLVKKIKPQLKDNKASKEQFSSVKNELKEVEKLIGYKQDSMTIQFLKDKSIIKELDDFPIIYTGLSKDYIDTKDFEALCNNYKVSNQLKTKIYDELTMGLENFVTQKNLTILCKVKLIKNIDNLEMFSDSDENLEDDSKEGSNDDSSNDDNSDNNSSNDDNSDNNSSYNKSLKKIINNNSKNNFKLIIKTNKKNKANKIIVENESDSESSINSIYK